MHFGQVVLLDEQRVDGVQDLEIQQQQRVDVAAQAAIQEQFLVGLVGQVCLQQLADGTCAVLENEE